MDQLWGLGWVLSSKGEDQEQAGSGVRSPWHVQRKQVHAIYTNKAANIANIGNIAKVQPQCNSRATGGRELQRCSSCTHQCPFVAMIDGHDITHLVLGQLWGLGLVLEWDQQWALG